jgi:hypothetical protein
MRRIATPLALLTLIIAACGNGTGADSTVAASPTGRQAITVTFDGVTCHYEGPDRLVEGPLDVTLVNESDTDVGLAVRRLKEGVTYGEFTAAAVPSRPAPRHLATGLLWIHRLSRGLEIKGELSNTFYASEAQHALLCLTDMTFDATWHADPGEIIHVASINVDEA